ncbi:MAG: GntR family transcriptional regulator [Microbacterium sp.]
MAGEDVVWPDEVFADLDRSGPIPLYFQVSSRLEAAIRDGRIAAGARLENEISIAESLGVSRPTVRRAIQEVVDKGLLVRRRGVGTQVVQGQVTRPVELTSLFEDLKGTHHEPGTKLLLQERRPASDEAAAALSVKPGDEVLYLRRLRTADGVPVAVLENSLPATTGDFTTAQLETQGLYQVLRARGVTIRIAKQRIGARRTTGDEADLLDVDKGSPVLTAERTAYDNSGRAVEFGHHCYRPDRYSFETTLVAK